MNRILIDRITLQRVLRQALKESIETDRNAQRKEGAGVLFCCRPTGRVLLALRSRWVDEPGVWGIPGGGVEPGESPLDGAMREAEEEIGYRGEINAMPAYTFHGSDGFRYHNFIGIVDREFEPTINWESEAAGWFHPNELPFPLHRGVEELMRRLGNLMVHNVDRKG